MSLNPENSLRTQAKPSLKEALLNRRMLICIFTGFSSGLPYFFLIQMVPAWLRTEGIGLAEIGLLTLVGFPYNWKFVWAPVMDRYVLPFLGRRRGWMLVTQLALVFLIAVMGLLNPSISLWSVAVLAGSVAFFSASQDVVLDAYRRELLPDSELGIGTAIHVQAYRFAGLIPGSLALVMADFLSWDMVFFFVAAFMGVGIAMTFIISENRLETPPPRTLREAVVEPFKEFISRNAWQGAILILLFMLLYKLGDNMATALQTPFFIDLGFSLTEIGVVAKTASLTAMTVGTIAGGIIMIKLGINRSLWIFGFVQLFTILGFAALAEIGHNLIALAVAMALEYLGVGLGVAALSAFIARSTNPAYAATQMALFTAIAALPRTFVNAGVGFVVETTGWTAFFIFCAVAAIPGMLLLFKVAPWSQQAEA